jgi:hypothetical protein
MLGYYSCAEDRRVRVVPLQLMSNGVHRVSEISAGDNKKIGVPESDQGLTKPPHRKKFAGPERVQCVDEHDVELPSQAVPSLKAVIEDQQVYTKALYEAAAGVVAVGPDADRGESLA